MRRVSALALVALFLIVVTLSGCTGRLPQLPQPTITDSPVSPLPAPTTQNSAPAPSVAEPLPAPKTGTASVGGLLFSRSGNGPVPGTFFYLYHLAEGETGIPVVLGSPRTDGGDVQGKTDLEGRFVLKDVPPGNYLLAVWAPLNWLVVPVAPSEDTARVVTLKPDEKVDLGKLELDWPQ